MITTILSQHRSELSAEKAAAKAARKLKHDEGAEIKIIHEPETARTNERWLVALIKETTTTTTTTTTTMNLIKIKDLRQIIKEVLNQDSFDKLMQLASSLLAYDASVEQIHDELVAKGASEQEAYLAYKAARTMQKMDDEEEEGSHF